MYMYIYIYICICIYLYIYIYSCHNVLYYDILYYAMLCCDKFYCIMISGRPRPRDQESRGYWGQCV